MNNHQFALYLEELAKTVREVELDLEALNEVYAVLMENVKKFYNFSYEYWVEKIEHGE